MGHGGQGTVWRAKNGKGCEFAIKICLQEKERVRVEVRNLKALKHPNVVKFEAFVELSATLVMEFIDGKNLKARLQERLQERADQGLEEEEAMWVMRGLLRGLSALHEKQVIHRDIKPDNIMLRAEGDGCDRVVIVDLGTSKQQLSTKTLTQAWTFLGTVAYASPEQTVGGAPELGMDVWAAGIVLFEMLEGRRPFASDKNQDLQLMEKIRTAVAPPMQARPPTHDFFW